MNERNRPEQTGERLGMEKRDWRAATGRQGCHQRVGNRNRTLRGKFERRVWNWNRHAHDGRIHLAMGEHRDRAVMIGFAGVRVDQFMQRRRGRQHVQQENNED